MVAVVPLEEVALLCGLVETVVCVEELEKEVLAEICVEVSVTE